MNIDRPVCVLDVESTGVDPVLDRIIELGVVILMPDLTRKRGAFRVNPGIPIPPESTEHHHITDADVAHCPPFSHFAPKVSLILEGKDLAGFNLWRMDLPMLDEELRRCDLKLDLTGVRVIDAFAIYQKKRPRSLSDAVREFCHREPRGAHGASADAEDTLDVLLGQAEAFPELDTMSMQALADYARHGDHRYADVAGKLYIDGEGQVRYAFGKQRDVRVLDDPGFGFWMLRKDFPASTKEVLRSILPMENY